MDLLGDLVVQIAGRLAEKHQTLAVAESCTGGFLADQLTNLPGASGYFLGGVVAYQNTLKRQLLGVSQATLERQGAVSEQAAREMALGICQRSGADYGLAITGIAGPSGGSPKKPVGTVFVACATAKGCTVRSFLFPGNRLAFKQRAAEAALQLLLEFL